MDILINEDTDISHIEEIEHYFYKCRCGNRWLEYGDLICSECNGALVWSSDLEPKPF